MADGSDELPEHGSQSSVAPDVPDTLFEAAREIVATADLDQKVVLARLTAKAWFGRKLGRGAESRRFDMPERPGRPAAPILLPPSKMPKRRGTGLRGRIALLHALCHIELNAVDMTWDLLGRFPNADVPRSYYDNWVQVGLEEAKHFDLLRRRLVDLGSYYGELPAHDGLWQTAQDTGKDLLARVAIVPLVLEARGLDVTPPMIEKLEAADDQRSADILAIIYRDEKKHVAFGYKWFRYLCARTGAVPEPTFHALVKRYFKGQIKPPFNDRARAEAGLAPGFYKPLSAIG